MAKKREDKFKMHRMIQLDSLIRSGCYPSIERIMREYGVSRRTVLRDIEFLRDRYDAPLEFDRAREGYFYSDPTFMIQSVLLTEGDLFTVSTIMPLLEQYKNTPLEKSFRNIMEKICELLPDTVQVDTSFLNSDVYFIRDPLPKIDEEVFHSIFRAVKNRETVRFLYKSGASKNFKQRTFDAYRVLCQKGNWYVIGFDHGSEDFRVFALPRIREISFAGERFEIHEDFDLEKRIDMSFGIWNNPEPPVEYELRFDSGLEIYISEREWHENQTVEKSEDGSVILRFRSNQRQMVLSWVLGFGSHVKVLKPKGLADEIKAEAKRILSN